MPPPLQGPFKFKAPLPVRFKVGRTKINPQKEPDIRMGKSFVLAMPTRVRAVQLEKAQLLLRQKLGKGKEFHMDVHATYATTKKPDGCKMGNGKGNINDFVARVPAGKVVMHIPTISPFAEFMPQQPIYRGFRVIAGKLPVPVRFRSQNNIFPMDRIDLQMSPAEVARQGQAEKPPRLSHARRAAA
ncbi:unnamed protein product [Vitrella brassicaformis CCMP3155]|uniref:Uncharacterized protein n=2 Tax=Vitrella brassicaformis TaxID=1169539 RepID=A0A0G4ENL4_VITBC|nr:unnamed protein product [Vitrella brassicaformis CCMP3155]|eukprot:CEL98574.1 unnamed protein product [Vitrella brassicaformis CCMP3155]